MYFRELDLLPSSLEITNDLSHISMSTWALHVAEENVEGWFSDFTNECQKGLKVPDRSFSTNIRCL